MTETSITLRDGTAFLDIPDPELWDSIQEATSFKFNGSEHRARGVNRPVQLVRNRKAPVGLVDRICRVMRTQGVVPTLIRADTTQAAKPAIELSLRDVKPRDYQIEAELAAQLSDYGIFRVPTGGGKTLITCMILIAKQQCGLVIVPTKDLLHQTRDYLDKHLDPVDPNWKQHDKWAIGQLGDGVVNPQPITVATIRTIAKVLDVAYETYEYAEYDDRDDTKVNRQELKDWVESIGTVIVDEAHQLGARVIYNAVRKIPAAAKYGMSASPWRDDGADLMIEAATGPPIFYVPAKRLVEAGHLMAPEFHIIDTAKWWSSAAWGSICANCGRQWLNWTKECTCGCRNFRSQFQEAYKVEIVENEVRNAHVSEIVQMLFRPTLVLVKHVKHGKLLEEMIPGSLFLSGKDRGDRRRAAFDRVRAGEQQALICTQIADQGLDLPNLGALVLAGGGKSSTRHLQRIGRVVRPLSGKLTPLIFDLNDSHIHPWFSKHVRARRKIEHTEWEDAGAVWIDE